MWNQTEIESQSVHTNVKCQQDKPQYNEKTLDDMAIVTEEQPRYRLQANTTKNTRQQLHEVVSKIFRTGAAICTEVVVARSTDIWYACHI
jgi:hypothetical protein